MFRYTLLTVAAYQAVSGSMALLTFLDMTLAGAGSVGLLVLSALALLYAVSGVLLARKRPRCLWLASALQTAQVVYVVTPWVQYQLAMGVDAGAALVVRTGPVHAAGITLRAYPTAMFHAFIGRPTDTIVVGINVVALGMLFALRRAANGARSKETTSGPPSHASELGRADVDGELAVSSEDASSVASPDRSSRP
jgi:hypothetical protein